MKKSIQKTLSICAVFFVCLLGSASADEEPFSEEVEQLLQKKLEFVKTLAEDPKIIELVEKSNEANKGHSISSILELDKKWRESIGVDDFISSFISNECAQYLKSFQEGNLGFVEIFISDAKGLIVGATNKTSDYYQADESWWVEAYRNGKGKSYYGDIEYDDSAHAEAIALYVPVIDSQRQVAIGVIKAVYSFNAIIMEL